MDKYVYKKIVVIAVLVVTISLQALAQNKDIDKGNETLAKAMEQKDLSKRQELVQKAIESYTKGGMKREMYMLIGDAYLGVKDYTQASSNYSRTDKEQKKEGMQKLAEAYVDDAFATDDEKVRAKNLKKAMDFYTKADAYKEGARAIGDRYYDKGIDNYDKAVDYYVLGEGAVKIEQIAKEYLEKGADNEPKAAEVYLKLKTKDGYKKAGDIYYKRKEYQKAIDAYLEGGVGDGIEKYADYLYSEHRAEDADNLILKLADAYSDKKDDQGLEDLGKKVMNKGSYELASKIYDKAGNVAMGDKNRAYDALSNFRLEEAKGLFTSTGEEASVKMIDANAKPLAALKDLFDNFDDLKKNAPYVSLIVDSVTGKSVTSASDEKMVDDYYKSIITQIYNNTVAVSTNYAKLSGDDLKKLVRNSFSRFGSVRTILDPATFTVKKQKNEVKVKDVVL